MDAEDARGKALRVGDLVMIPFFIRDVVVKDGETEIGIESVFPRTDTRKRTAWASINPGISLLAPYQNAHTSFMTKDEKFDPKCMVFPSLDGSQWYRG
jgi:hypothetical protein